MNTSAKTWGYRGRVWESKTWEYRGRVIEEDFYGSDGRLRKTRTGYLIRRLGKGPNDYEPGSFPTLAQAKKEIDKMTPTLIRVPERFYVDHMERALPTPEDVGNRRSHAMIRADDPALGELLDDAEHYAYPHMFGREYAGLVASAKATVRAIRNVIGWEGAEPEVLRLRR